MTALQQATAPYFPPVTVMNEVDVDRVMTWLPEALAERWPRATPLSVGAWLRTMMNDRQAVVFCTVNAIAVAEMVRDLFEPQGVVYERVLRGNAEATEDERQLLVIAMRDWAQAVRAREFRFNLDSDARQGQTSKGPGTKNILSDPKRGSRVVDRTYHIAIFDGKDA